MPSSLQLSLRPPVRRPNHGDLDKRPSSACPTTPTQRQPVITVNSRQGNQRPPSARPPSRADSCPSFSRPGSRAQSVNVDTDNGRCLKSVSQRHSILLPTGWRLHAQRDGSCTRPHSSQMPRGRDAGIEQRPRTCESHGTRSTHSSPPAPGEGGFQTRRSGRPWTAPVKTRYRYRDNMQREEEYQRGRQRAMSRRQPLSAAAFSEETKKKQEEVIRRILDQFDLEDTKDKYRNANAYEHRPPGNSLADYRFRSELIRMMGSEMIRLGDQSWSQKFQDRLNEDYERQLDEQEQTLAEAERQRIRRLRIEGIIPDNGVDYQAAFGKGNNSLDGHSHVHLGPKADHKKKKRRKPQSVEYVSVFMKQEHNDKERELHEQRLFHTYRPTEGIKEHMERMRQREEEEGKEEGLEKEMMEELQSKAHQSVVDEAERHVQFSKTQGSPQHLLQSRKKRCTHLPPDVAKLYEEETVSGLYTLARHLISSVSISKVGNSNSNPAE